MIAAHMLTSLSPVEWALLGLAGLFTAWSVWKSVQWTFVPGETEPDHLKRLVLLEPPSMGVPPARTHPRAED